MRALAVLALAIPVCSGGQAGRPAVAAHTVPLDSSAFGALRWREVGPFRGGRSVAVAGSAKRPHEYYMGTTGGGVFKTTDGGETWEPLTDRYYGGSIGSIAVSESDPDVVYVGTGEYDIRGDVSHGDGVFKSIDGGKTWSFIGLGESRQISRVRIDPRDPRIVYVGVQGHVWSPNSERGVYKTTDGGSTWRRVLFRNDSTGVSDLVIDPAEPNTIYAAFWQSSRTPWTLVSGGAGSGIFKSTDAGEHWTELTRNPGLPRGVIGNIGLAVSPSKPNRVWALIEADSGGVFRSDDGGASWTRTNDERKLRQRPWYFSRIFADPRDANVVYVLNVNAFRSDDGGGTFTAMIVTPSTDTHELWIAPNDPQRMVEADDGGAAVSINGGRSWTAEAQATGQFYHVATTNDFPYRICGAQQDWGTLCGPSRKNGGIGIGAWYEVGGGESGYIAVRPDSPNVVFAGGYGGRLTRTDTRTMQQRTVSPWPDNPMGYSAGEIRYRFQWTYPIVLSPNDPNTLYAAAQVLFRSRDDGMSWQVISPDLTRHDPRTLGPSGGPITKDQTSVEYYGTVFAVAESPVRRGVIWAGSDDGLIHLTRDGGATWANVTPPRLPEWARISIIEPSHYSAATAYVAANHYQMDDLRPYLYKTTDYGRTWVEIVNGMPAAEFTRTIREDPVRRGLLYAGTERGVWVSFDDGGHWQSLRRNLPIVPVHDLAIKDGDLIAATHGRGFWILDDISPLRELTPGIAASDAYLFTPRRIDRARFVGGPSNGAGHGAGPPLAGNPPSGAMVYYWLKAQGDSVTVDILDAAGRTVRTFTNLGRPTVPSAAPATGDRDSLQPPLPPNAAGLNRFVWNLRTADPVVFRGMVLLAGHPEGARVTPGSYAVRLTVNGRSETRRFAVLADPRSGAMPADLAAQFALVSRINDTLSAANNAVRTIRNVKAQLLAREATLTPGQRAAIRATSRGLLDSLSRIEEAIYQVRTRSSEDPLNYPIKINDKLAGLAGSVDGDDGRPTAQDYRVFNELSANLEAQLSALHAALLRLAPLNAILLDAGLPAIVPDTTELTPVTTHGDEHAR